MAAAVASHNPTSIGLSNSPIQSRTDSPMANKAAKQESDFKKNSPVQSKTTVKDNKNVSQGEEKKLAAQATEPLAPPPRPSQQNASETPDYFSAVHNGGTINHEFNPFEQSFGAPSSETPGKTLLPPVASLTSPNIPGAGSTGGFNWQSSLRSGPLSPAMLTGPQQGDYFDSIGRGFPTPNESSLRTGLTPGGGGSMFPAPSPNSQALFNHLQSGAATPGTLDFHRTAMTAAARNKANNFAQTSNPQETTASNNTMDAQHDATDAANGLFMLAKGGQANNQFAASNQSQPQAPATNGRSNTEHKRAGESPESQEDSKPNARATRGKKANAKNETTSTTRRKSEATPKGANKRSKGNSGNANVDPALDPEQDDDDDDDSSEPGDADMMDSSGKKMTDEEKRRNFLERNRVAALKCRQRKKQWLANLQAKCEMYSAENDTLNNQVAQLHDEIRHLRALLMGHKDCPVGHAQGIGQFLNGMPDPAGFPNQQMNPYGIGMPNGAGMQPGVQRS